MKKNFFRIALIALAAMLVITGCSGDNSANVSTKTVRVIGTYGKMDTPAARALSRAAEPEKMGITSVDKVVVNGKDITDALQPVEGQTLTEGANNITFEAQVEVPSKVSFTAEAKEGYVFAEWEVLEIEEKEGKAVAAVDPEFLEQIEDWLEDNNLEHSATLKDVPAEYIPYLVAEYDNGYYIDLDAQDASKKTVDQFAEIAKTYEEEELTLVISGSNADAFKTLLNTLNTINELEELKLQADEGTKLESIPSFGKLKEIELVGFTFDNDVVIESANAKYELELKSCTFNGAFNLKNAKEIELKNCTMKNVEIAAAGEIEIKGGTAENITVTATEVEELELKNLAITGKLDLSAITKGEVELKNVTYNELANPADGVKFKEKKSK